MIDISKITDHLYVGSRIVKEHADEMKLLKFDLILSMIAQMAPDEIYTLPPFKTIWIRTYDSIIFPIPIKKLLMGVEAAVPVVENKGKVLVFCMEGRRRSVAMAACILIATGKTAHEAIELLMSARKVADPRAWYIKRRIYAFERYWHVTHPAQKN